MPNSPGQALLAKTRRLVALQCGAGVVVAAGFYLASGQWDALSAGYGSAIGVLMTLLLSQGISLAGKVKSTQQSQLVLYAGAVVRFMLVLALFGLGLAGLGLAPLATVIGFIAAQLVFPLSAIGRRGEQT